jgi:hypothetical protein
MPQSPWEAIVNEGEMVVTVFAVLLVAGLAVIWMGIHSRRQVREMEHREKMAMIERGLMPSPELDPGAFEERMGGRLEVNATSVRSRTAGIMMMGIGFALMVLITFTGERPAVGLGVGGAFAVVGAAFFINARMLARDPRPAAAPKSFEPRPSALREPRDPGAPLS